MRMLRLTRSRVPAVGRASVTSPAACHVVPDAQPLALQQDDVSPAELREVIGDAAADDASADHDHESPVGQRIRHVVPPVVRAVSVPI